VIAFEGRNVSGSEGSAQLDADQQILAGASATPTTQGAGIPPLVDAAQYAQTIVGEIRQEYPNAQITLTGHSFGGRRRITPSNSSGPRALINRHRA
jgi:thioesterase domain-containing protein